MADGTPQMGPATPGSLIAQPKDIEATAGAGLIDSGGSLIGDVGKAMDGEWDALALSVDGASVALDILGIAMNPLGELVKGGVGWLMEHVWFLREPLELLTGDPKQVAAVAETWTNIAREFSESADAYRQELTKTGSWEGDGASAYRATANDYVGALEGIAGECENTATGVSIAGMVVGTVRSLIFDMIASFISRIITQALIAAATSVVSLGSSVAVFITSMLVDLSLLLSRIGKKLAKLIGGLSKFARKFDGKSVKMKGLADRLSDRRQNLHNWAHRVEKQTDTLEPKSGWGKQYNDFVDGQSTKGWAEFADHTGTKVVKESAKSVKDGQGDEDK